MPHKIQHHSHQHLTLQTTLIIVISGLGLNLYFQLYGINTITFISGTTAILLALVLFVAPILNYGTKVRYETNYESTKQAFREINNVNDPFFKEKIQTGNASFKQLTENKIEAHKPFIRSKFGIGVQIEKENSVENKSIKYNIRINQQKVMNGRVNIFEQNEIVYIEEEEETLVGMPIFGTLLSESKTVKMFQRTAIRKNYKIKEIEFNPNFIRGT